MNTPTHSQNENPNLNEVKTIWNNYHNGQLFFNHNQFDFLEKFKQACLSTDICSKIKLPHLHETQNLISSLNPPANSRIYLFPNPFESQNDLPILIPVIFYPDNSFASFTLISRPILDLFPPDSIPYFPYPMDEEHLKIFIDFFCS